MSLRPKRFAVLMLAAALCLALVGVPAAAPGPAEAAAKKHPRAGTLKRPLPGRYAGKVGTFARIVFDLRGRAIFRFNAGVKTNCQRSSDGFITETKNLATAPGVQEPPQTIRMARPGRRWVFGASFKDEEGAEWKIRGRFVSRAFARGKLEASRFESIFNPFAPYGVDGQLCSGSGEWTAAIQRAPRRRSARR